MDDNEKSLLIEDGSQSFFKMKGNRTSEINTDVLEINVRKLIINASQSTEITTNDYILNALSKIYIFSNWMKQSINGFMHLFSNKALINSSNAIDIEAKEAKFHGTEKAILHSDKKTLVNSKGTAEVHGTAGNLQTNTPEEVTNSATEKIALATVYFRPLDTWNGEFGFDWLREADNGLALATDPAYVGIIESGYKDGTTDLTNTEAYAQLKTQYPIIPIKKKPAAGTTTPPPDGEYFVPYLTLFSKEFVTALAALPIPPSTLPKFEAELKVLLNIEDDIVNLQFEYDKTLFEINKNDLQDKQKTTGLVASADVSIKITCLKDLDTDKEIFIYAYPKLPSTGDKIKDLINPVINRKLAGKIIVLKNDRTVRKEQKFVLVGVRTNVTGKPRPDDGRFTPEEKQNFYNTFYQALTIPIMEEKYEDSSDIILDLSNNADFQSNVNHEPKIYGKYTYRLRPRERYNDGALWEDWREENPDGSTRNNFHKVIQQLFFEDKDAAGNLKNRKYTSVYFTVFSLRAEVYDGAKGQVEGVRKIVDGTLKDLFLKNLIIFPNKDFYTMNHEGLHGFNLRHTHRDSTPIDEPNYKYIFPLNSTNNVMCYRDVAYSTWRWQWHIINPNISEK